VKQNIIYNH